MNDGHTDDGDDNDIVKKEYNVLHLSKGLCKNS